MGPPKGRWPDSLSHVTRVRLLALFAAAAALLAACGSDTAESEAVAASSDDTAETATAILASVSGGQIDINSLEGQDTVLCFWAPW